MGIARSTFYDEPTAAHDDTVIVEAIAAICDEFEFYGWRRVRAELRHRGMIVNHKKIRRLMREHDLQLRIPIQSGRGFRFDVGRRSDFMSATIPK